MLPVVWTKATWEPSGAFGLLPVKPLAFPVRPLLPANGCCSGYAAKPCPVMATPS